MLKFYVVVRNFLAEPVRNLLAGAARRDDRGATAVEYGLMVTFIAIVIIAVVTALGTKLKTVFTTVTNGL